MEQSDLIFMNAGFAESAPELGLCIGPAQLLGKAADLGHPCDPRQLSCLLSLLPCCYLHSDNVVHLAHQRTLMALVFGQELAL